MEVDTPAFLTPSPAQLQARHERINILGHADSQHRVILQSWTEYKAYSPSFKLDDELDILILEYLIDFLSPTGPFAQRIINNHLLKDEAVREVPRKIFFPDFGNEVQYISDNDIYSQTLHKDHAGIMSEAIEQWGSYGRNCMFTLQYVDKGGYTRRISYIHFLPDFIIEYMLIYFTVDYFNNQKINYSGDFLKQTLNRFDMLFKLIKEKSTIYEEDENGTNPSGFGSFVSGYTQSRYKMQHDRLDNTGHIVFLGNGICDLHQHLRGDQTRKIVLNDLNPLFPLLSLHIAHLPGDTLNQYEVIGGSVLGMKYEENSLTKVYAGYLLKYLSASEIEKIFQDIGQSLKVGGRFYIDELSENALREMSKKVQSYVSGRPSRSFPDNMKSQPSMDFLISTAAKNNLRNILKISSDYPQQIPQALQEESFIRAKVKSYHLIFEKIN